MLHLIMTELFVPKGSLTSQCIRPLLDVLFAADLTFEQASGRGGRCWAYPRWYESRPLDEAVRWVDFTWSWSIELWMPLPDGSRTDLSLEISRERGFAPFESIGWSADWRHLPGDRRLFAKQFLMCSLVLANLVKPLYGWGGSNFGLRPRVARPIHGPNLAALELQEIEWLNVFGPPYIERIGPERLLAAPAWRRDVLTNGCVALTLAPDHERVDMVDAERLAQYLGDASTRAGEETVAT